MLLIVILGLLAVVFVCIGTVWATRDLANPHI